MPEPLSFNSIPMILEIRRILCLFQFCLLPGVLLSFELFRVISETDHRHNSFSCLFSDDRSCRVSHKRCPTQSSVSYRNSVKCCMVLLFIVWEPTIFVIIPMECILRLHCSMDLRIKEHSDPVLFLFLQFHSKIRIRYLRRKSWFVNHELRKNLNILTH